MSNATQHLSPSQPETLTVDDMPYIFDADDMFEWFFNQYIDHCGIGPSADEIATAGARVGRNDYPALVFDLHFKAGILTPKAAASVVPSAWISAEHPMRNLYAEAWIELFNLAGYTRDGVPAERPTEPLTLYRGAVPEHREGWSWTADLDLARWFADRFSDIGRPGRVYIAQADLYALLAHLTGDSDFGRQGESEFVVNPADLNIRDLSE